MASEPTLPSADGSDAASEAAEQTGSNGAYVVGYGRPPRSGQIKPGEVRNPRGKRPGTRSLKSEVRAMLATPVPMRHHNGKMRNVTTRVAALFKLREKALKGDQRALDRVLELSRQFDEEDGLVASTMSLMADDEQILANRAERERLLAEAAHAPPLIPPTPDDKETDS